MKATRQEKLDNLIRVVSKHLGKRGKPVKLNGVERGWDMGAWDCDTTCCAFGSAAHDLWFNEIGLRLIRQMPYFEGLRGSLAAMKLFEISYSEAYYLFMPESYENRNPPPSEVIERIKQVANRYAKGKGDLSEPFKL